MARKPKKKTRKHLEKANDKTWSLIVRYYRKDDPRPCAICGETFCHDNASGETVSDAEAHHLIHRGNLNYRWDVYNGVCLCSTHHRFGTEISAHGRMGGYADAGHRFDKVLSENVPEHYAWYEEHVNDKRLVKFFYCDVLEHNERLTKLWKDMNTVWDMKGGE